MSEGWEELRDHPAILRPRQQDESFIDADMASFHEAVCDLARYSESFPHDGDELSRVVSNINYQVRRAWHLLKGESRDVPDS